jgi:hypothetical protein
MDGGELLQIVNIVMNGVQVMFLAWLSVHAQSVARDLSRH